MDIFQILFYQPTFNLLVWFTNIFGNIGWAIIAIALLSKLLTIPLTRGQIKNVEKSQQLQTKMKELRKKYKHNEKKLAEEMARLQAAALPGQLGGCLSLIIFLVLFLQIRGAILDLVNKGYVSFNQVAYTESLKKKEDFVKLNLDDFSLGEHELQLTIGTDNAAQAPLTRNFNFYVTENKDEQIKSLQGAFNNLDDAGKQSYIAEVNQAMAADRAADIGIYNKALEQSTAMIPLSQFLFFTTESLTTYILTDNSPDLTFYLRPPSNQLLDYSRLQVALDGNDVTPKAEYQQGDKLNLNFAGTNLSRVASDFGLFNLAVTLPYIIIALISGVTQYFVTKLYSGNAEVAATVEPKKEDKDGKPNVHKPGDEQPDFAEMMSKSTKQMNMIFPAITVAMSLGYLGGASFFPTGVTLFWTAQNTFVIMQQMISQRKRLRSQLQQTWNELRSRFAPKKS